MNAEHPLVAQLRQLIDRKHHEALDALGRIAAYLSELPAALPAAALSSVGNGTPNSGGVNGAFRRPKEPTFRDQVLSFIADDPKTVDEIVEKTGLTVRQIRGVLSAPDLRDYVQTNRYDGKAHYWIEYEDEANDEEIDRLIDGANEPQSKPKDKPNPK
jgi:hypothetical protein